MNQSQALMYIEQQYDNGELEEATRRYTQIVVGLISDAASEELLTVKPRKSYQPGYGKMHLLGKQS